MKAAQSEINRPIKQALWGFSLTFIVLLLLMTAQFIFRYHEDIFDKQLDNSIIITIFSLGLFSIVELCLPISILVMASIYYRESFRLGQKTIKLKHGLLPSISISVICFMWIAFITPINNLHMGGLLYDIIQASPNEPLERTDLTFFEGATITSNYFQLNY